MEKPFGWPEDSVTLLCSDGFERRVTMYQLTEAVKQYRRKLKLSRKEIVKTLGFTHKNEYVQFIRGIFDIEANLVHIKRVYDIITKLVKCGDRFITLTYTETHSKEYWDGMKSLVSTWGALLENAVKPSPVEEGLMTFVNHKQMLNPISFPPIFKSGS